MNVDSQQQTDSRRSNGSHVRVRYRLAVCVLLALAAIRQVINSHERQEHLSLELIAAISALDASRVEMLLDQGADPNTRLESFNVHQDDGSILVRLGRIFRPERGNAVLLMVIDDLQPRKPKDDPHDVIFEALLRHGADCATTDTRFGWSALNRACLSGQIKYVDELLRRGALNRCTDQDVAQCLANPFTELSPAGDIEVTSMLLRHGANPNARFNDGVTALWFATRPDKIDLLLRYGADPHLKDKKGMDTLGFMTACSAGRMSGLVPPSEYRKLVRYLNLRGINR